jgi:hypothetical protein
MIEKVVLSIAIAFSLHWVVQIKPPQRSVPLREFNRTVVLPIRSIGSFQPGIPTENVSLPRYCNKFLLLTTVRSSLALPN